MLFVRWRFPQVPHYISFPGAAVAIGLVILLAFPGLRMGTVIAGVAALGCIAFAIEWQFARPKPKSNVDPAGRDAPKSPPTLSPTANQGHASPAIQTPAEGSTIGTRLHIKPAEGPKEVLHNKTTGPQEVANKGAAKFEEVETGELSIQEVARRSGVLRQLTQLYIFSHDGITPRMMAGMELPPAEFLNPELERSGETWRVRSVNGAKVETYNIPAIPPEDGSPRATP